MSYVLKVERISKSFLPPVSFKKLLSLDFRPETPITALKDISFSLRRNAVLCILGPNGAGKTTLLKIIATLILPDEGTVTVGSYRAGCDDEKIRSFLGLILGEERSFYWRLTGRQNLAFFAALYGLDRKTAQARIDDLLALFQVDYADQRFDTYSTGMKNRLAFIRSLLHNPQLLLLDEPTKSLDYTSVLNLKNFVKENLVKTQGKTVIFTTHRMDEALDFADLFMILHKGRLIAMGTLDELRKTVSDSDATLSKIFLKLTQGF